MVSFDDRKTVLINRCMLRMSSVVPVIWIDVVDEDEVEDEVEDEDVAVHERTGFTA